MTGLSEMPPVTGGRSASPLKDWIHSLASKERKDREAARLALVAAGAEAIPHLIECLSDKRVGVRWEAAKALADIADPTTATALVQLLEDEESGVRWLAAEGLINMECDALPALLAALERASHSQRLREGAHHVIHELHLWKLVELLTPVRDALEKGTGAVVVPVAASRALDSLRREPPPKWRRWKGGRGPGI